MADFINMTIADWMDQMALRHPDRDAVVNVERGLRQTYSQFNETCRETARAFLNMGIKKGDHVAIWATNYPEWLYTFFACCKIGAVLVTVNTNYKIFEAEYLLRQSDTHTLIFIEGLKGNNYVDIVNELVPEIAQSGSSLGIESERLPRLKNVVYVPHHAHDPVPEHFAGWHEMMAGAAAVSNGQLDEIQRGIGPHDITNMQYTSGTTGFPKGVMLTHYNILNNGMFIGDNMGFTEQDRLCVCVPLFHCFGLVLATMAAVTHGTALVLVDYFSPLEVLRSVEAERCTALHGVPTMFIFIMDHPEFQNFDVSTLRTGIMAGSNCPEEVMRRCVTELNMTGITSVYGQTESSPGITQSHYENDPLDLRVSTVGRIMGSDLEVKIIDPETGKTLGPDQNGELCCRGYNIMRGYYNMEEATRQAIDPEGWLHTGDLATVDEGGYYRITGRIKDMIIRGGENIYPREIEELLYTHTKVQDVQVVGITSQKFGEEVMAFIILKEGQQATEEEICDFVRQNVSRHKVPSYVVFVDTFPMTASGKIQKFKLREQGEALVAERVKV